MCLDETKMSRDETKLGLVRFRLDLPASAGLAPEKPVFGDD